MTVACLIFLLRDEKRRPSGRVKRVYRILLPEKSFIVIFIMMLGITLKIHSGCTPATIRYLYSMTSGQPIRLLFRYFLPTFNTTIEFNRYAVSHIPVPFFHRYYRVVFKNNKHPTLVFRYHQYRFIDTNPRHGSRWIQH